MFNGIIFNQGTVKKISKRKKGINLFLKSNIKFNSQDLGISVSCDGACLTLTSFRNKLMEFYLSNETIKRSKFKYSKIGDKINLELPLKYGQKISGQICQGHVDTVGTINKIIRKDKSLIYDFKINKNFIKQLVEKASILINGVSLTISKITKIGFQIWIIPHTLKFTNLCQAKKGDLVNIEIDILSKYVNKYFNEK
jgi:riboflavin synthase